MPTHQLLIYELISNRLRGKLLWLGVVLILLGLYDLLVTPFLGPYWFVWWLGVFIVGLLWFYYGVLMRRARLIIRPEFLLLQGPLASVRISYGRIQTITITQFMQHIDARSLRGRDRALLKPLRNQTCPFIALKGLPRRLQRKNFWFSRFIFSERENGLLLVVADWMQLSRDVEAAQQKWREKRGGGGKGDKRTFVGQILDW